MKRRGSGGGLICAYPMRNDEIIARAAANRHTSRARFIVGQAEQLAGDPRVRDILNRLADLGSDELVRYARTMLETIHATERRMQAGSPTANAATGLHR